MSGAGRRSVPWQKGAVALGGAPSELRGAPRLEALYVGEAQDRPAAVGEDREEQ